MTVLIARWSVVLVLLLIATAVHTTNAAAVHRHPTSSTRQAHAEQCQAKLVALKKKDARQFCRSYLHGRQPTAGTIVTLPASTITTTTITPSFATTSITTTQTTQPDEQTTTTSTTFTTTTTTSPEQQRRSVALETRGAHHPSHPNYDALSKYFSAEVITDACFLLLYGRLSDTATTTQLPPISTAATAATSTSITTTTLVVTIPPTSTSISTTTTTSITTATVAPTPVVRDGSFDQGKAQSPWTFTGDSGVGNNMQVARTGGGFAFLQYFSPAQSGPFPVGPGGVQQTIANLIVQKAYIITFYIRTRFIHANSAAGSCTFTATASGSNSAGFASIYPNEQGFGSYSAITLPFIASQTTSSLQFLFSCTGDYGGQVDLDDVSIAAQP